MPLIDFLWRAAARYPHIEALVDQEVRWSYRELAQKVETVAVHLAERGVRIGDHVIVVLKNRRENVLTYWACQRLGAIYTPINFRLSADEIGYCARDAQGRLIIAEASLAFVMQRALAGWDGAPPIIWAGGEGADSEAFGRLLEEPVGSLPYPLIRSDATAIMLYTAGTTGRPKGVPRSHLNEISAGLAHIIQNSYQMRETSVGVMPFYHTMGMRILVTTAMLNGKLVLLADYDCESLARLIVQEGVSALYLVPTLYYDLVNWPGLSALDLSALTKIGYAGASMTRTLTRQCFERLHPQVFVNHFGSSEVYTFTVCQWLDRKPTCAGRPGLHEEIRIVAIDNTMGDPEAEVSLGQPGEVIVRLSSPEAFAGYWNRPEATAKAIRQGWYYTGDVGYWDEEGDLWVYGRIDDMLVSGGENIHPLEVEEVLSRHPEVAEVAVVGLPDDRWGQAVTAFVVPKNPRLTAAELDRFCQATDQLASFKRPRRYVFVRAIPKSPVGKILRRMLREGRFDPLT